MKKILFWLLLPVTYCAYVLFVCLEAVSYSIVEGCYLLEKWCFGVPDGMRYIGSGRYSSWSEEGKDETKGI